MCASWIWGGGLELMDCPVIAADFCADLGLLPPPAGALGSRRIFLFRCFDSTLGFVSLVDFASLMPPW